MPTQSYSCGSCKETWTGLSAAHCSKCHLTFTGITAFDDHRGGSHVTGRYCLYPGDVLDKEGNPRLVRVDKMNWSGWGSPSEDSRWD